MKEMILVHLVVVYLLMSTRFLTIWLEFFRRDSSLSSQEKHLSWVTLVVATIFWPIVVPLAYLELLIKAKKCDLADLRNDSEQDFNP